LVPQVEQFYKDNAPDVVLYDRENIVGRIMAVRLHIPAVQMSAHFAYYDGFAMRRNGIFENPDLIVEWSDDLDAFLSTYEINSKGSIWHIEELNIHFIPVEFQPHADWFDNRFCFVGALLNRQFRPTWTDKSNGRPVILISGISLFSDARADNSGYFRMLADALAELPYWCILSIGNDEFSYELPSNFELNKCASHLEILPHAALSICHGGMTTTLEAIYYGVPVLMIPPDDACGEVAYRAEELGLGVRLAKDRCSMEDLRETTISMLQDRSLLERVRYMRDVFRRSGGAGLASNRIEDYLVNCWNNAE
jgi:MGT family glycosyltransferase